VRTAQKWLRIGAFQGRETCRKAAVCRQYSMKGNSFQVVLFGFFGINPQKSLTFPQIAPAGLLPHKWQLVLPSRGKRQT